MLPEFRLGVQMPALKARIFDLVQQAGVDGIDIEDLWALTYTGNRDERTRKTVKAHIWQINEAIEDEGYRIVCSGGAYRLKNLNGGAH